MLVLGVDFGTTNTVLAGLDTADGAVRTVRFGSAEVYRSVLCFWEEVTRGRSAVRHASGPGAIAAYLEDPLESRLVMSTKTYLASPGFRSTVLLGRTWTLEALIGLFLRDAFGAGGVTPEDVLVVAGRPVRFAGEGADDALGEARLRASFAAAGIGSVEVALEPEAAGYRFTRSLHAPATVLIGDFGGGTSDFSVLRFTPGAASPVRTLGRAGIGIAGDVFDGRIMERVVAPLLGKGSTHAPWGQSLPVPAEWYGQFARWHRLSLMRTPKMAREIAEVRRTASAPERLDHLWRLIEDEQGYALYRAVSEAKAALSTAERTVLRFAHGRFVLEQEIGRAAFEGWIARDLAALDRTVGAALADAGLEDGAVDQVFLTGGTALVPAVRGLFERRFGAGRLAGGGEFVSVAEGLALIGAERLGR